MSHTATGKGMAPKWVLATRGWTPAGLGGGRRSGCASAGCSDAEGELTEAGAALRKELEARTDRLDRAPYEHLGAAGVERLTGAGCGLPATAASARAPSPADLIGKG